MSEQQTTAPSESAAIHNLVKERYGKIPAAKTSCCGPTGCGEPATASVTESLGYDRETLDAVPDDADLGLGCGNPTALAALSPGEVVVDLGSGAGLDALIAARNVGPEGRVIGVDMTPEMLTSARKNAVDMGVHGYVEFREGTIEDMPVSSESADVVISNCVINLSPDKPKAFREAFRVLKPGGRLAVSDIVLSEPLPSDIRALADVYVACVGGASTEEEYVEAMRGAGFVDIELSRVAAGMLFSECVDPMIALAVETVGKDRVASIAETVFSYKIKARKPDHHE